MVHTATDDHLAPRTEGATDTKRTARRSERTCVGCGGTDEGTSMIRLVVAPDGEVAVDLAGGQFGRGAHVHPSPSCIALAPRGLSKSFRRSIRISPAELGAVVASAAERRAFGLLSSAIRARKVEIGGEETSKAGDRVHLMVVARDAAAAASLGAVMTAVREGRAVSLGTKSELGALVGKSEVAVLGLTAPGLAAELKKTVMFGTSVAANGSTPKGHEPPSAHVAEDR